MDRPITGQGIRSPEGFDPDRAMRGRGSRPRIEHHAPLPRRRRSAAAQGSSPFPVGFDAIFAPPPPRWHGRVPMPQAFVSSREILTRPHSESSGGQTTHLGTETLRGFVEKIFAVYPRGRAEGRPDFVAAAPPRAPLPRQSSASASPSTPFASVLNCWGLNRTAPGDGRRHGIGGGFYESAFPV